jgi:hypothetical protein
MGLSFRKSAVVALIVSIPFLSFHTLPRKVRLFEPDRKNTWHIFLSQSGLSDPNHVFEFLGDGSVIHATGQEFGYIITEKKYRNFHFTVLFIWGEKKYPPREKDKRDAGVMYHVNLYNGDKIWPRSLECQVQEGDCGDLWMTDSTTVRIGDTLTPPKNWFRAIKQKDGERPKGQWNKLEIIVKDGTITHIINDQVVNTAHLGNTTEGYIALQSEGAEIFYREPELEEYK